MKTLIADRERLREMRPIEMLDYELSAVFRGNSLHADFLDDVPNWGLVTERQPIGIGTTFRYIVSKLTPLCGNWTAPACQWKDGFISMSTECMRKILEQRSIDLTL